MTRTFLHVFGVLWVACYLWMLTLYPFNPAYEILSLAVVFGFWRVWRTLRSIDV